MDKFIVLLLTVPLLGAGMCEAKTPQKNGVKSEVPGVVKGVMKPVEQVPKEYKDAVKKRQDRLEESIEASGGAP